VLSICIWVLPLEDVEVNIVDCECRRLQLGWVGFDRMFPPLMPNIASPFIDRLKSSTAKSPILLEDTGFLSIWLNSLQGGLLCSRCGGRTKDRTQTQFLQKSCSGFGFRAGQSCELGLDIRDRETFRLCGSADGEVTSHQAVPYFLHGSESFVSVEAGSSVTDAMGYGQGEELVLDCLRELGSVTDQGGAVGDYFYGYDAFLVVYVLVEATFSCHGGTPF